MARLFLQNESASFSSSGASTITGSNGSEIVTIGTGIFTFDASFNRGGDTIILSGNAGGYNVSRSNTQVTLTSDDGQTTLILPAGTAGITIQFADATRALQISNGQVLLGSQAIGQGAAQEVENGTNGDGQGNGTPQETPFILTADAPSVAEGNAGTKALTFTVSLDRAPDAPVTVNYSTTTAGSAVANTDFQPVSGTLTFAAGQTTATVTVLVNGDVAQESDKTIVLSFTGAGLDAPVNATGTIINDDLGQQLTTQNDIILGTGADEIYEAFNNTLNAGDRIDGAGGSDTLRLSVDGASAGSTYSGFQLRNVETVEVTNDGLGGIALDLSSSRDIDTLRVSNGSQAVSFNQVTELANVELENLTNPAAAATTVQFQDAAVAGEDDTIGLTLDNSNAGLVRIGSVGDANGGIENLVLETNASASTISQLDTDIRSLTINARDGGSIDIAAALNGTIRTIDAGASAGKVTLDASAATGSVEYTGSSGVDDFTGSAFADIIDTGEGDDKVLGNGGSDVINLGDGANEVNTGSLAGDTPVVTGGSGQDKVTDGAGNATISTLGGDDLIDISAGGRDAVDAGEGDDVVTGLAGFDASVIGGIAQDVVDGGEGTDTLRVNAGLVDAQFNGVSSIETLRIETAGTTTLQGDDAGTNYAQRAGIVTVYAENAGSDVLQAGTFTSDLTVFAKGGNDTIRTGRGADTVNMQGDASLTDADNLNADGSGGGSQGRDTLNLSGNTTVSTASQFRGFEQINLGSARGTHGSGNAYSLAIDNDNAPTANGTLTIDGAALSGSSSVDPFETPETVSLNASGVSAYALDVTTGSANDVIVSGTGDGIFRTNAGADSITLTGGTNSALTGEGDDTVVTLGGVNRIELGAGDDEATLGAATDTVLGEEGDDVFHAGANLTAADTVNGGEGEDRLEIGSRHYADADFTNVSSIETLEITTNNNAVLGTAASGSGITTVVSSASGRSDINAAEYGSALTFDLRAGGHDQVVGTAFDDVVVTGTGNNNLRLGAGEDRVIVSGNELTSQDVISGGAIADGVTDTIELDNSGGAVTATVNLDNVTSIELYEFSTDGDRNASVADVDNHSLTFSNGAVGSLTAITVDASRITDSDDSVTVVIDGPLIGTVNDPDYAFNIIGAGAGVETNVMKLNSVGNIQNNINFSGQDGDDNLFISGNDLGGTVTFSGGGGTDSIRQIGGDVGNLITDDGYRGVSGVEVLTVAGGGLFSGNNRLNAVLGSEAGGSGLTTVIGGSNGDDVIFDAGFGRGVTIDLLTNSGGNDDIDAGAVSAAFTFMAATSGFNANDQLIGGNVDGDVLQLRSTGTTAVATSISNIETIIFDKTPGLGQFDGNQGTTIRLDSKLGELQSEGSVLTVNAEAFDSDDVLKLSVTNSTNDDANYAVTAGAADDVIVTGRGADVINARDGDDTVTAGAGNDIVYGEDGNDDVSGGAGNDQLFGGEGVDRLAGGLGDDMVDGGTGDDLLRGDDGVDTILGGAGADRIYGGAGADILDGGDGADIFYYASANESAPSTARDVINNFESHDLIDIRSIAGGDGLTINFVGNVANFSDAQGAVQGSDGDIDVVFQQDNHVLWFDIDNNGQLDGNDLQIVLTGVSEIDGSNVFSGAVVDAASTTMGYGQFNADFTALNMA
ncbi:Calx-beta domain-containing protein [Sphingobium sp. CFD-2]|uniref:beta strand repeat-containing protein n=1 Tax=Sphingobium sp. CFD-2 TaxID=2878542 RepID=UPI00214B86EA|nr:Calx-beta domain-containing protein [Sphingobium sp. CFD-2]